MEYNIVTVCKKWVVSFPQKCCLSFSHYKADFEMTSDEEIEFLDDSFVDDNNANNDCLSED